MKKLLLLSSSKFIIENKLSDVLNISSKDFRILHVVTVSKGKGVEGLGYLERTKKILKEQGFHFENIDIAGKTQEELRTIMNNFDGVFVNGGSAFYLLKSIRESEFDKIIKDLLPKGFVYIGASAGSYVLSPTIEMALWRHQDKYDHYGITDFTGMNIVPFLTSVHYIPEYEELVKEKVNQSVLPVKILTDKQAILVKDDQYTLLGGDKEIIF